MFIVRLVCHKAAQDPGERRKAQQHSKINAMHVQTKLMLANTRDDMVHAKGIPHRLRSCHQAKRVLPCQNVGSS